MAEGASGRRDVEASRGLDRQAGRGPSSERQPGERPYGFPKSARLLRSGDYRKVYAEGRRRNLGILTTMSRATGEQSSRIGMAVSRAFGNAVERNRLKRRLREAIRKHRAELGPGWDIVFHPRPEAKAAKFAEIEAAVRTLFADLRTSKRPRSDSGRKADS
jgi:ribonuclease P protein component